MHKRTGPTEIGTADVVVIVPDGKVITLGCEECRRVHTTIENKFLLGLIVTEKLETLRYFIAGGDSFTCCGHERRALKTFETEGEANLERGVVLRHIEMCESTEGLDLIPFDLYSRN